MRVKAKAMGFYGCLREVGDVFDITSEEELGGWMEPVKAEKEKAGQQPAPAVAAFAAYHVGAGKWGVKDAAGERVGEFVGTKEEAIAEAERLIAEQEKAAGHPDA